MRDDKDQREDADSRTHHAAEDTQREFLDRLGRCSQRDDVAGDERGVDAGPVELRIDHIAEHRRAGRLQRIADVIDVRESVGQEKSALGFLRGRWRRRGRRLRKSL